MVRVKEIIIVEGNYDKIKLSSFIDGIIFVTGGFSLMSDEKRLETLITLAKNSGAVILTDSDSAGFRIRSFLKQKLPEGSVKHAYIPDVKGKERRKTAPGAEGLIGVEGMEREVILKALRDAGCEIDGEAKDIPQRTISKAYLFSLGLTGAADSAGRRKALCERLGIPSKMSSNMLCSVLGRMVTPEELEKIVNEI
ncbi:MAG: DUF4093 domain-containing protein [Clostridia bacterium]|nr:DUF4093 domain-containing protein [Clostridia bacterium]